MTEKKIRSAQNVTDVSFFAVQFGYFRVFGSKCYILDKHRRSNLLLNLMKVSYLVMAQTLTLTVSTTISPERLKRR